MKSEQSKEEFDNIIGSCFVQFRKIKNDERVFVVKNIEKVTNIKYIFSIYFINENKMVDLSVNREFLMFMLSLKLNMSNKFESSIYTLQQYKFLA